MIIKIRRHCGSVRESVERCHGQTGDRTGLWPVMVEEDRLMCISPAIMVQGSGPAQWVLRSRQMIIKEAGGDG